MEKFIPKSSTLNALRNTVPVGMVTLIKAYEEAISSGQVSIGPFDLLIGLLLGRNVGSGLESVFSQLGIAIREPELLESLRKARDERLTSKQFMLGAAYARQRTQVESAYEACLDDLSEMIKRLQHLAQGDIRIQDERSRQAIVENGLSLDEVKPMLDRLLESSLGEVKLIEASLKGLHDKLKDKNHALTLTSSPAATWEQFKNLVPQYREMVDLSPTVDALSTEAAWIYRAANDLANQDKWGRSWLDEMYLLLGYTYDVDGPGNLVLQSVGVDPTALRMLIKDRKDHIN